MNTNRRAAAAALLLSALLSSCSSKDTPTAPRTASTIPTVRGSVQLPNHAAADFAFVGLMPDPAYPPVNLTGVPLVFFTDSVGAFEFFDVPAGHYFALAGIPRDTGPMPLDFFDFSLTDSLVTSARLTVTAPNAPVPPLHLTLDRPGAFKGRVVDALTGLPTDGLVTTLGAMSITPTDTDGVYVLRGVAPGTWTVSAIQFVDSVTTRVAAVSGVLGAPGDTVTIPDLRLPPVSPTAANSPGASLNAMRRELRRMAALRERRMAGLPR